jgi:hypothetical protein
MRRLVKYPQVEGQHSQDKRVKQHPEKWLAQVMYRIDGVDLTIRKALSALDRKL